MAPSGPSFISKRCALADGPMSTGLVRMAPLPQSLIPAPMLPTTCTAIAYPSWPPVNGRQLARALSSIPGSEPLTDINPDTPLSLDCSSHRILLLSEIINAMEERGMGTRLPQHQWDLSCMDNCPLDLLRCRIADWDVAHARAEMKRQKKALNPHVVSSWLQSWDDMSNLEHDGADDMDWILDPKAHAYQGSTTASRLPSSNMSPRVITVDQVTKLEEAGIPTSVDITDAAELQSPPSHAETAGKDTNYSYSENVNDGLPFDRSPQTGKVQPQIPEAVRRPLEPSIVHFKLNAARFGWSLSTSAANRMFGKSNAAPGMLDLDFTKRRLKRSGAASAAVSLLGTAINEEKIELQREQEEWERTRQEWIAKTQARINALPVYTSAWDSDSDSDSDSD